jgi:small-conductance mechanosensitive channel
MDIKKPKKTKISKTVQTERHFVWLWSYIFLAAAFLASYLLLRFNVISIAPKYHQGFQNLSLALFLSVLVLTAAKFLEIIIIKKTKTKFKRYNLIRLTHFLTFIAIIVLVISFVFSNWYAAAVSLGLISLILGFALQTPISSFIGWIYILIRNPYRIGDRIQLDTFKGDVVEIGYLDTTLWEFAGDYLTNDLPSGRLIRFPNSLVLQSTVINYSWRNFQFIWNEIPFHVAYESDLEFLEKTIKEVTKSMLGENMAQHIEELRKLVKESPIDDMEIKSYPYVSFRINPNTWVEATVTYLVAPKEAASIRTRIIKKVIEVLMSEPERTMFPRSNAR